MDTKIESKITSCHNCKLFTNKTTREPIQPHITTDEAWKDVSVDLFGPMPDNHHVVAVIDKSSRYPAAKIVPNTSNKAVTKALSEIYADYGQPDSHQTDNGPPFNSAGFESFSTEHGIQHIKTHPYHPQGNPVENFMRPIGKSMKAAHYARKDKKEALNDMLSSYRATPHPSTGIAPGNILFRSGYKKVFPRTSASEREVKEGLQLDRERRQQRGDITNSSNHRMQTVVYPNQLVYVRNNERRKFDPLFGPELHKVIDVRGNGTTLLRLDDDRIVRRHLDDVKDVSTAHSEEDSTCWVESNAENAPALQIPLAAQPTIQPIQAAPAPTAIVQRRREETGTSQTISVLG